MLIFRKLLCAVGFHRWGLPQDWFPLVPNEADCTRIFFGDGSWPNYPYRRCGSCTARKKLPKTYESVELPTVRAIAEVPYHRRHSKRTP